MDRKYRKCCAKVIHSVVTVEVVDADNNYVDHYVGSVLLNSQVSTFILTATKKDTICTLRVHFSNQNAVEAKIFARGPFFSVLIMPLQDALKPLHIRDKPPLGYEDTIIVAPTGVGGTAFMSVLDGSVILSSCYGTNRDKVAEESSHRYFLTTCSFHDKGTLVTNRITSAPVFDLDGDCVGFIFFDCSNTPGGVRIKSAFHGKDIVGIVNGMHQRIDGQWGQMCPVMAGNWKETLLNIEREQIKQRPRVYIRRRKKLV